ncbi:hypothetical protein AB0L06_34875 [Spirillospora sp. NPDC052269]
MRTILKAALVASVAMACLATTTVAASATAVDITRQSGCGSFIGTYTYWSDNNGWYGYTLGGTLFYHCSGGGTLRLKITGSQASGPYSYTVDYHLDGTEQKMITQIRRSSGVKDIRIALLDA